LGGEWLDEDEARRNWVEEELRKLIADPPKVTAFSAEDIHDDFESFVARGAVQCWANEPRNEDWRMAVGSLVAAYRYRTIHHLFAEAFRNRQRLGTAYGELEGLLLAYAVVREKAGLDAIKPQPKVIE